MKLLSELFYFPLISDRGQAALVCPCRAAGLNQAIV
jgi:hypothetical protein